MVGSPSNNRPPFRSVINHIDFRHARVQQQQRREGERARREQEPRTRRRRQPPPYAAQTSVFRVSQENFAPPLTPAATFPASDHSYPHPPPVRNSAELAQRYAEQPVQFPLTPPPTAPGRSIRPTRRRDDSVQQQSTRTFGRDNDPLISESPTGNLLRQFPRNTQAALAAAFSARRDGNNGSSGSEENGLGNLREPLRREEEEEGEAAAAAAAARRQQQPLPPAPTGRTTRRDLDELPIGRCQYTEPTSRHNLGSFDVSCSHCGAIHWPEERVSGSSTVTPKFGVCCNHGKVVLPLLNEPPPALLFLFTSNNRQAVEFRENIRQYNAALAFTSMGVHEDKAINNGGSTYVYRINGELCHRIGALVPSEGQQPQYAQLYIHDPHAALAQRMRRNSNLRPDTMASLQALLLEFHAYSAAFKHAHEVLCESQSQEISLNICLDATRDQRRYNLPTVDEVAAVLPGDGSQATAARDIVIRSRDGPLYRIDDGHPAYSCLHYVLLFPFGEDGWSFHLRLQDPSKETPGRLSQTRFYAFRLQQRPNEFSTILRGCRLLQQYMVDAWASCEQNRLNFLRRNQDTIRASLYSGLEDAIRGADENVDLGELGQRVILPSSYQGSPRHMFQIFQDAMTIARYYQKADLFLTMTANPKWVEILSALLPGQTSTDRPDLIARVFQLKKKALLADIYKANIFGHAVGHVHTIEFQKRGLPHMHALIFFAHPYKILNSEDVDSIVSAAWPDPESEPMLFDTVKNCLVHGPCGAHNRKAPCMEDGICTKRYPKEFRETTDMDPNGYPLYRRPDDDKKFEVRGATLDNRWIVPHNPFLTAKYNCHINVECAVSFASLKYITKYIHKGHDRATMELSRDEIKRFVDARYVSAMESAWRIFHFPMHELSPNIVRLQVHLPGQHLVRFTEDEDPAELLERARGEKTTLSAFFEANRDSGELGSLAHRYTYQEFPQHFVVKRCGVGQIQWKPRQRGWALGRMFFVSPTAGERFHLRTLLTVVKGPTSFENLRTINGIEFPTFRDACIHLGLLEDDGEWRQCLLEGVTMQTGTRLRGLFATMLLFCNPARPEALWDEFKDGICDDLHRRLQTMGIVAPTQDQIYDFGLYLLDGVLRDAGRSLSQFENMPQSRMDWDMRLENRLIAEQLRYDRAEERAHLERRFLQLNTEQLDAYSQIATSVEEEQGRLFFLNGPAGTGKTFLYNTVCHKVRSEGWIVLCVASSGIASLLLRGGRTSHSMFKIPIDNLTDESTCPIAKQSERGALLKAARMVIWDEVPMQHKFGPEAVDKTCQDIRNDARPFGGMTVVFGGDFQQILPVIPKGSREMVVGACLQRSYLWDQLTVLHLKQNMRLEHDLDMQEHARWLLDVGHGRLTGSDGSLRIPDSMGCDNVFSLIDSVYAGVESIPSPPPDFFLNRTILSARNEDVDEINSEVLHRMPTDERLYLSADTVEREAGADADMDITPYSVEFLRSLKASGLPPGELHVKIGCPLILLRNLDHTRGLCNGTRMVLLRMTNRVLEVRLIGGDHDGEIALIPRIGLNPSAASTGFTFKLRRHQFPVRLAFAMSINKAQGQSVKYVGLDLRSSVFTHGQLYVAFSRATSGHRIKVVLSPTAQSPVTKNIVYPEVLLD